MQPIIPKSYEDAYRIATGFVAAGMAPDSYLVKRDKAGNVSSDGISDQQGTIARVALGIMKGMEIGLAPVTAISTIMIVNNRTSVWGEVRLRSFRTAASWNGSRTNKRVTGRKARKAGSRSQSPPSA